METRHIQHLYHRVGFGITPKSIAEMHGLQKAEIVDLLFKTSQAYNPIQIDTSFLDNYAIQDFKDKKKRKEIMKISRKKIVALNQAWLDRILNPTELLREKMTLFWANHFVCEDKYVLFAQRYNNTLRENALGDFKSFVKVISKEPAMLKYLNNKQNKKRSPNENFARELLELFTLGQGNYTERDIKECARAFTGYNHTIHGDFILHKKHQDQGLKTFMGQTGYYDGDAIIDIIVSQKQCARFICNKIYQYFVNEKICEHHIDEMIAVFYPSYNIESLMRFVLSSEWFYSENNIGSKIKSPIELIAGIHTTVPFDLTNKKQGMLLQKLLGQVLLFPPNVAGWKGGRSWIDSNTIVTRLRLPSVLLNNAQITYSDKGGLEDDVNDLKNQRLRKKTFIKTIAKWNVFEENYENLFPEDLITSLLATEVNTGVYELLKESNSVSKKDFCIQLLSLPEYQLC
ncbi:DUF1800 family protein [Tenacibaculum sp. SG-28]|uniref:DUF1800 domain-containing protein n=1 Tax=Tenacibaculum sp. SG-28 TaxID=754426 RepID=UPI000CF36538|nr:DUF1800 domain-containing protein [Tenacibaculum sp. SG-28]PQJ21934.1 hypothetical protein BSU00_07900 [Tenacibaculum sp. SG-28]